MSGRPQERGHPLVSVLCKQTAELRKQLAEAKQENADLRRLLREAEETQCLTD